MEDLKIWGDDFIGPNTKPDVEGEARIIPKGSYYYFLTDGLKAKALVIIGKDGDGLFPFEVYLSDIADEHRYVAKFKLLIKMKSGDMTIHTQQLGINSEDWVHK